MGSSATAQKGQVLPSGENNGKTLDLLVELCQKWGYSSRAETLQSLLIASLSKKGYTINYSIEPKDDGKRVYYVFKMVDSQKKWIFSNKEEHKSEGAIVASEINESNIQQIIDKIIE